MKAIKILGLTTLLTVTVAHATSELGIKPLMPLMPTSPTIVTGPVTQPIPQQPMPQQGGKNEKKMTITKKEKKP